VNILFGFLDCWQILPQDRPTFNQLYEQINTIIETNYQLNNMESNEESYSSLQQDWRKEIQDIFEELKTKEQVKRLFNVTSVKRRVRYPFRYNGSASVLLKKKLFSNTGQNKFPNIRKPIYRFRKPKNGFRG
jgi:hypothetical protein